MTEPKPPTRRSPWDEWYRRALPAYWIFLFCLMHFPKLEFKVSFSGFDKMLHAATYALLAFLFWRFAETFARPLSARFVWIAVTWIGLYGAFDEWTQPYFNRGADVFDWLCDVAGAALALGLLERHRRRLGGRSTAETTARKVDSSPTKR